MVVHEGQRPFACKDCGQRFARKERLKHHADRCHGSAERNTIERVQPGLENGTDSGLTLDPTLSSATPSQQMQQLPQQQQQQQQQQHLLR